MPARLSRHALAACAVTCAVGLATTAPAQARPAGHPPTTTAFDARNDPAIQTGSLAGTTEANPGLPSAAKQTEISAPDDGATTFAVVVIAGGALLAGAGAGFAGGRRLAPRTH